MPKKVMAVAGAAGAVLVIIACTMLYAGGAGTPTATALIGEDFGQLRREALGLFPRGKPVREVKDALTTMGFRCAPMHRPLANINAAAVECDSAGRGYPLASRTEVTVMARNGALSDIAVGNGVDGLVADARTPDPAPGGHRSEPALP